MMTVKKELNGKRLLILGGSLWKNEIRKFCLENGITIIAAGNDPGAGICDIADEYYEVNSTDRTAMKDLIRDKRIDGVYLGGNEPVIAAACEYVNELHLPCYCNKEQWNMLQDKSRFKELCEQFGLPVAKRLDETQVKETDFPLIVKPVDGCSSTGFSVCRSKGEFEKGLCVAKDASPTGRVIIEPFLPNDGIVVIYTVADGKLLFSAMEDKYPALFGKYGTYVGALFDFESSLIEDFRGRFEDKIRKMVDHLGIREGNFWIEVFCTEGKYYFNEAGFRYGGSGTLYAVDYCRGINQIAMDIYFCLTGKSRSDGFGHIYDDSIVRGKRYAIYPVFLKTGTVEEISGTDLLLERENILTILFMKRHGSRIPDNGSFSHVALLVHFTYSSRSELNDTIDQIHDKLSVRDADGRDLVIRLLDTEHTKFRGV